MAGNPDDLLIDMGSRIVELERLATQNDQRERDLRTKVEELSMMVAGTGIPRGTARQEKDISESKAALGLRVLPDDRPQHKEWHAKFVNAMAKVRPGFRGILRELEMHKEEEWTEQDFDLAIHDDRYRGKFDDWSQDVCWVLVEKTTGEALRRVKGVDQRQMMQA